MKEKKMRGKGSLGKWERKEEGKEKRREGK